MQDFLKINDNDNVVVALNTIPAGEKITVSVGDGQKTVTAREEIPAGHKMAIFDIPEGGEVIKYGYRIGNAKENIAEGSQGNRPADVPGQPLPEHQHKGNGRDDQQRQIQNQGRGQFHCNASSLLLIRSL